MCEFGVRKPCLLRLHSRLRLMQRPAGSAMRRPLRFQGGLQFRDARLEHCRRIMVASAVQDDHRNAAILDKPVAWTHLISTLLRRLAGRALQAQGATHAVFSRLRIVR